MSKLALQLIANEKQQKTGTLDIGNCGLTNLPKELFELHWLEELTVGSKHFDFDSLSWISSKNTETENILSGALPQDFKKLSQLKRLFATAHPRGTHWTINDISVLEHLPNLERLALRYNKITDISALTNLTKLTRFSIGNNELVDITPIEKLTNLVYLNFFSNKIVDISALQNLTKLKRLNLSFNRIVSVIPLCNLTTLTDLRLTKNQVVDIYPLEHLTNLTYVGLDNNQISDITIVGTFLKLKRAELWSNQINDIRGLLPLLEKGLTLNMDWADTGIEIFQNPMNNPPYSVIEKGNQAVIDYFNEPENQGFKMSLAHRVIETEIRAKTGILDLSRCGLINVPKAVFDLVWLEELIISNARINWEDGSLIQSKNKGEVNRITGILPEGFRCLKQLKQLHARNGFLQTDGITDISSLSELTNLEYVDLSHHEIKDVSALSNLKKLVDLRLIRNKITDMMPLGNLKNIQHLDLGRNKIHNISNLGVLPKLETLNVSDNKIQVITNLDSFPNLKKIHLNNNQITKINGLEKLYHLNSLDLGENQLKNLNGCENLSKLEYLFFSANPITDLEEVGKLKQLKVLRLWGCQLTDISPLAKLTTLEVLWLQQNQITDVSPLSGLSNLRKLGLDDNKISDIKPLLPLIKEGLDIGLQFADNTISIGENPITNPTLALIEKGRKAVIQHFDPDYKILSKRFLNIYNKELKERTGKLNIGQCDLTEIPFEVFNMYWLEELILSNMFYSEVKQSWQIYPGEKDNHLKGALPKSLKRLRKLKKFCCSGTDNNPWEINDISILGRLKNLEYLHLGKNKISDISALSNLKNLRELELNKNEIKDINALTNCRKMQELYIYDNELSNLNALSKMSSLRILMAQENFINDVSGLSNLGHLKIVSLYDNYLDDISALSALTNLHTLYLHKNQIQTMKPLLPLLKSGIELIHDREGGLHIYDNPLTISMDLVYGGDYQAIIDYLEEEKSEKLSLVDIVQKPALTVAHRRIKKETQRKTGKLDLGNCNLTELPTELFELEWLEELRISNRYYDVELGIWIDSKNEGKPNCLSGALPKELRKLKNLKRFYCNGTADNPWGINDISGLTECSLLERIDLSYNKITDLYTFANLSRKIRHPETKKYISASDLIKFDEFVAVLEENKKLIVSLEQLGEYLVDIFGYEGPTDLDTLYDLTDYVGTNNYKNYKIEVEPSTNVLSFSDMDSSSSFSMGDYEIMNIETVDNFTVKYLNLSHNQVTDILPILFFINKGLQVSTTLNEGDIQLVGNPTTIPTYAIVEEGNEAILGYFKQVEEQRIADERKSWQRERIAKALVKIEAEIEEQTGCLDLRGCELREWPEEIFDLDWLETLILSNATNLKANHAVRSNDKEGYNRLSGALPQGFQRLTKLKVLYCGGSGYGDEWGIDDISVLAHLSNLEYCDLRINKISDINALGQHKNLKSLFLGENRIQDIEALSQCLTLEELGLQENHINDISALENLTQLKEVHLNKNYLRDISSLKNHINLVILNLSESKIQDISALAKLTNLQELSIGESKIRDISVLANCTQLTRLYLSSNKIKDITAIANLTNLDRLTLSNNEIEDVSPLQNLLQLKDYLHFENNEIRDIESLVPLFRNGLETTITGYSNLCLKNNPLVNPPAEIVEKGKDAVLYYFDNEGNVEAILDEEPIISEQALFRIYEEIENKTGRLDLGRCGLTTFPKTLFDLDWLEVLYLDCDGFGYYDYELKKKTDYINHGKRNEFHGALPADFTRLTNLKQLHYTGHYRNKRKINDISILSSLPNLEQVMLDGHEISDISSLANLRNLKHINFQKNRIEDISSLENLTDLRTIRLSENKIRDISVIKAFGKLIHLDCSKNKIQEIEALTGLFCLEEVYLDDNEIQNIRPLRHCFILKRIRLSNNEIKDISCLAKLWRANYVSLHNNEISSIYPLLEFIKEGKIIVTQQSYSGTYYLNENPLSNPPLNIVEKGGQAIVNYFEAFKKEGEVLSLAERLIAQEKQERTGNLDIGNCDLTTLPASLFELHWLEELLINNKSDIGVSWLSKNKGESNKIKGALPQGFKRLTKLKKLYITGHDEQERLTDISALATLLNLEELLINNQSITDISALDNLVNLRILDISGNNIGDVLAFDKFTKLEKLHFNSNYGIAKINIKRS